MHGASVTRNQLEKENIHHILQLDNFLEWNGMKIALVWTFFFFLQARLLLPAIIIRLTKQVAGQR
jgi:hypothetical protein